MTIRRTIARAALLVAASSLAGCAGMIDRLSQVGEAPPLSSIENPVQTPGYRPVSLPMPRPEHLERNPNSLWRTGARAFFKDQRASKVGDILTVVIDISDQANISNQTTRSRTNAEDASASNILGYESSFKDVLPEGIDPTKLVDLDSSTSNDGKGTVNRTEDIEVKVAAVVTQILPNGNLVIQGRQETRVNFEVRELRVAGIIRREDISSTNTVDFEQIAEARISYGGRGQITDVQQPRYGQQIFDIVFPF